MGVVSRDPVWLLAIRAAERAYEAERLEEEAWSAWSAIPWWRFRAKERAYRHAERLSERAERLDAAYRKFP